MPWLMYNMLIIYESCRSKNYERSVYVYCAFGCGGAGSWFIGVELEGGNLRVAIECVGVVYVQCGARRIESMVQGTVYDIWRCGMWYCMFWAPPPSTPLSLSFYPIIIHPPTP